MKNTPLADIEKMKRSVLELEFHCKLKNEIIEKQEDIIDNQKRYISILESQSKELSSSFDELKRQTKFIFN